jgi:hypothetical protein
MPIPPPENSQAIYGYLDGFVAALEALVPKPRPIWL